MKISIDTDARRLAVEGDGRTRDLDLFGKEAYEVLAALWLKTSWNQRYSYTFTWFGRPIIQHPEDLVRLQEVIYTLRPDVIIETGVAHGGSLIFYASLFRGMGYAGRVIGVDVEIRPNNRRAIDAHELKPYITLVEGDSVGAGTVNHVASLVSPTDRVLVLLDSDHSYAHVSAELEAYSRFVSPGSYIVSTDGIMRDVADAPRGKTHWVTDNPANAAEDFLARHPEFVMDTPAWRFNESDLTEPLTAWPSAWLRRADSA